MRVLDPRSRNPFYKAYHKASSTIGDGGVMTAIAAGGTVAPLTGGILVDGIYFLGSLFGLVGVFGFKKYRSHTKSRTRITTMVNMKHHLPREDYQLLDSLIAEVYHCGRDHYDFRVGRRGLMYVHEIETSSQGRSFSCNSVEIPRESEAQWQKRQAEELILKAGYGCKYCGERIVAASELVDVSKQSIEEDNTSVEAAKIVIKARRESQKVYDEIMASTKEAYKELTS